MDNYDNMSSNKSKDIEKECTYDAELVLDLQTRIGYTFLGWSESEASDEIKYQNNGTVKNLTAEANGSVTLYAKWQANVRRIVLKPLNESDDSDMSLGGMFADSFFDIYSTIPEESEGSNYCERFFLDATDAAQCHYPVLKCVGLTSVTFRTIDYLNRAKLEYVKDSNGNIIATDEGGYWTVVLDGGTDDIYYRSYYTQYHTVRVEYTNDQGKTYGTIKLDGTALSTKYYSKEVKHGDSVTIKAIPNPGYLFECWSKRDKDGNIVEYEKKESTTITVTEDLEIIARFKQDSNGIYEWEGSYKNKRAEWISKTYVGATPFAPSTCKVDATEYSNSSDTDLELSIEMFSSPEVEEYKQEAKLQITSQNARRIPPLRKEKFLKLKIETNTEVDSVVVGKSMGGLVV